VIGLTAFISSLQLCTTVVVRSAVTGPDSSRCFVLGLVVESLFILKCQRW